MQQLLDKWERLRKSEYLRPDEKLMLNHCISDLKRFMDHSVEANEMVGNRTAGEWLIGKLQTQDGTYRGFCNIAITHEKILIQAKEMEKEKQKYFFDCGRQYQLTGEGTFNQVYNETYGGNK